MSIRQFSYVSSNKISQLYEQFTDIADVTESSQTTSERTGGLKASGGLAQIFSAGIDGSLKQQNVVEYSGKRSDIQKLRSVIWYLDQNERVDDLNELCRHGSGARLEAFAYTYRGEFRVGRDTHWQSDERRPSTPDVDEAIASTLAAEHTEEVVGESRYQRTVSGVATLESRCSGYTIDLACSLRNFTNMGSHAYGDELSIHPHSGNHHFFSGHTSAFLEGLVFVTAVRGQTIVGSPLFLNYYNQPGLAL